MSDTPPPAGTSDRPIGSVVDERVALGQLHAGLVPFPVRWDNDFRTVDRGGDEPRPRSAATVAAFREPLIRGERTDWIGFAIYELPDLPPIGGANARDYTNVHHTAKFGITIGEVDRRSRGPAMEATRRVLDDAFTVLNDHNAGLDTQTDNAPVLRAYARAGSKEIGRRRQAYRRGDRAAAEFMLPAKRAVPLPSRRERSLRSVRSGVRGTGAGRDA
jgi:RimJ/RimL family protein N-acetyltransferase